MDVKEIRCFQHCSTNHNIFCFNVTNTCPLCSESLSDCSFLVPPFCLPSPFSFHLSTLVGLQSSNFQPIKECGVVVKPTHGNFLSNYTSSDDLHIGVTNSQGVVFSFDSVGVLKQTASWDCCLSVEILPINEMDDDLIQAWDEFLEKLVFDDKWDKAKYDVTEYNCYNFVINFLSDVLKLNITKKKFCDYHILPITSRAAKFISLYHELQNDGTVVKESS